jgi:3-deoxy-D-manno-octulosonate 8-phosphate phosphatase (KDO 8-P phosphatase)
MIPARIVGLFCDVDGVLTPNLLSFGGGAPQKAFHVRDGHGLVLLGRAGISLGFLTGRDDPSAHARAAELGIEVRTASNGRNKGECLRDWLQELRLDPAATVFVGDDVTDLAAFRVVGWPVAVADAHPAVRRAARRVTRACGGAGALREVADWVLARLEA